MKQCNGRLQPSRGEVVAVGADPRVCPLVPVGSPDPTEGIVARGFQPRIATLKGSRYEFLKCRGAPSFDSAQDGEPVLRQDSAR